MTPTIAVVGGTGNLGSALAWRLARAGYRVIIGSRSAEAAVARAAELGHRLTGMANADAAAAAQQQVSATPNSTTTSKAADPNTVDVEATRKS